MDLLAISVEKIDFREIRNSKVECGIIQDAEHILQDTFSEENCFSEENNPRCAIQNVSVSVPNKNVLNAKVGCLPNFCLS